MSKLKLKSGMITYARTYYNAPQGKPEGVFFRETKKNQQIRGI